MSDTPKKKASPAKVPAKKKAPAKKPGIPAKKPSAKKVAPPKTGAQRGRPRKVIIDDSLVHESVDAMLDALDEAEKVIDKVADSVIIRANDIKKKSLRERMLKWFKR